MTRQVSACLVNDYLQADLRGYNINVIMWCPNQDISAPDEKAFQPVGDPR